MLREQGRRARGGLLGAAVVLALGPSLTHAATICVAVSAPSCGSNQPNVQAALDAAESTAEADRVVVGAGIFDGPFLYVAGIDAGGVDLVGQGPQTILTESPNAPVDDVVVLDLRADVAGNAANVSDVAVHIPANATAGNPGNIGIDAGGLVQRVHVSGNPTDLGGNSQVGVVLGPGERLTDSEIRMPSAPPGGSFAIGVSVRGTGSPQAEISTSVITGPIGIEVAGSRALVSRSVIASRLLGVDVCASEVVAEDSVFRPFTGVGISVNAGRCGGTAASLTARHLTIVGAGVTAATGIEVSANNQAPTVARTATISHSIIRDVETAIRTSTQDPAAPAPATTSIGASIFEAARVTTTSDGGGAATLLEPQANIDADALFADPLLGDFSLLTDSPAVDNAFSPPLASGESATDLAGNPRIADGDGDGTAERDIGAFERPGVPTTSSTTTTTQPPGACPGDTSLPALRCRLGSLTDDFAAAAVPGRRRDRLARLLNRADALLERAATSGSAEMLTLRASTKIEQLARQLAAGNGARVVTDRQLRLDLLERAGTLVTDTLLFTATL
jgi:hypothetical protein